MNYLKHISLLVVISIFSINNYYSQDSGKKLVGGLYFTYNDFFKDIKSFSVYKGSGSFNKNNLTEVIKLKVKDKDSSYTFKPGDVFGYTDGKDKYRFYRSAVNPLFTGYYKIREVGFVIIYEKQVLYKSTKGSKMKGLVTQVFFSKEFDSPIKELSYSNLSDEFRSNANMLYIIDKMESKCKNCLTKKTRKGYNLNIQITKYIKSQVSGQQGLKSGF